MARPPPARNTAANLCLDADDNVNGLADGRRVQLWDCYNGANELWDFGGLLANAVSYPLFLETGAGPLSWMPTSTG